MLKKAKARREYCRDKIERVHHWKRSLHHQFYEYQGRISNLKRILEHDIPRANAALLHILRQLDISISHTLPDGHCDDDAQLSVQVMVLVSQ